ncbi:MAG: aminotransferase class IV, partial [Chitinophagaceae bacterium]
MILTGGYSPDSYQPASPNLVLLQQPLQLPPAEKFKAGVKVITHTYQRELPEVKSTNYLMGIWLQQQVRAHHAADVLYQQNGIVSEFPRANVFIVTKRGKLVTPAQNILKGITRMKLLQLAQKDFEVEERAVHLDEVKDAAEVFMTSTTKRLLPISHVDDVVIGAGHAGPVTTQLNRLFIEMENRITTKQKTI